MNEFNGRDIMNREILPILMILLMFAIAYYVTPLVQANESGQIIGHWGINGQPNGMVNKFIGVYLIPVLTLIFYIAFLIIPKIEVYQKNIEHFSGQFWGFKVMFVFVMGVIYVATLLPNLGYWGQTDPMLIIIPAIGLLFFYVGYMLNFTKRNYFIGVRTPWTLADEKIWEKTNKLASRLFWICGALAFLALVAPGDARIWIVIGPVVLVAIFVCLYSLYEYMKLKRGLKLGICGKKPKKARKK